MKYYKLSRGYLENKLVYLAQNLTNNLLQQIAPLS